jgi:hypothetical protein
VEPEDTDAAAAAEAQRREAGADGCVLTRKAAREPEHAF